MKIHPIKRIVGDKVILKPFSVKFVSEDYLNWMNDKETSRFISKADKKISLNDLFEFTNEMINSEVDYFFAILLKINNLHVGNVRLGPIDFKLSKISLKFTDLKKIASLSTDSETLYSTTLLGLSS